MKTKKRVRMSCVVIAVSIIASIFTGCKTNVAEGLSGEQVVVGNSGSAEGIVNQVQATPMDACLNLDLGMFTLYGRPLGDWTYEELYGYVCDNFEEKPDIDVSTTVNGVKMQGRFFINPLDKSTANIIDELSSIQLNVNGVSCVMVNNEWSRSLWSLSSYNQNAGDIVSSICGQRAEDYLESICPGLYAKLQEEPTLSLKDGLVMMDSLSNGMQRISLSVNGGNLELGYEEGVITSLTVLFTEYWQTTTDVNAASIGDSLGQNTASVLDINLGQYKFLGKTLLSWKITDLADYIRNTYELEYSSEGQETFFIGEDSSEDRIWINSMPDGTLSIDIYYASGVNISISGAEGRGTFYGISCDAAQMGVLEELGATELAALFGMTLRDYVESMKPGLYDTLTVDEGMLLRVYADSAEYILLSSTGSLEIQVGSVSVILIENPENGLISYCSVSIY